MPSSPTSPHFFTGSSSNLSTPISAAMSIHSSAASTIASSSHSSVKITSSGRGGAGNIRRVSIGDADSIHLKSRNSSTNSNSTQEDKKDGISAPKGLDVGSAVGIKTSGRGGSGNIGSVRKALGPGTATLAALDAREREVLAAHRAKKNLTNPRTRTGRGGVGNISAAPSKTNEKPKPRAKSIGASLYTKKRSSGTSVLSSRRSSSSSRRSISQRSNVLQRKKTPRASNEFEMTDIAAIPISRPNSNQLPVPTIMKVGTDDDAPVASTSRIPPPPQPKRAFSHPPPSLSIPSLLSRPSSPLPPNSPKKLPGKLDIETHSAYSGESGNPLATNYTQLYSPTNPSGTLHDPPAISIISRPASPLNNHQRTKLPAGGGAEWRLVTHVREERRGRHQIFIEEQGWEYLGVGDLKKEAMELKGAVASSATATKHAGVINGKGKGKEKENSPLSSPEDTMGMHMHMLVPHQTSF